MLRSTIGGLPVEVWDGIIDFVAEDVAGWKTGGYLQHCILVCKSWVPRCNHHLSPFKELTIRSAKELESFAISIRTSPKRPRSVLRLTIEPEDEADCQWIAKIPILLPRLPNLRRLTLSSVNFYMQHPRFRQIYSLFRHAYALNIKSTCTRWSQVLSSVAHGSYVTITTSRHDYLEGSMGTLPPSGPFTLRSQNLQHLTLCATWDEHLELCQTWYLYAPQLGQINLQVSRDIAFKSLHTWAKAVAGLFHPPHYLPRLGRVSISFPNHEVLADLKWDSKTNSRTIEVIGNNKGFYDDIQSATILAYLDPHEVTFLIQATMQMNWPSLDTILSDSKRYHSLTKLNIHFSNGVIQIDDSNADKEGSSPSYVTPTYVLFTKLLNGHEKLSFRLQYILIISNRAMSPPPDHHFMTLLDFYDDIVVHKPQYYKAYNVSIRSTKLSLK
ncbi:hypothetical protein BXZ70DRAFT_1006750 [Cristinia sonorae]|uniref:Uncharacterized protein n=1 Tax=Cristinia sonorae TaxID=1940300 RepID=A0A8K0XRD9_9AGAR|nr:hypothetical protein BXZ70DRAFT_1006750 [Cristinia sonorae]